MTDVNGKVAVITGAGSGIGRALAYDLARRGAKLAISDVDTAGLAETAQQAAGHRRDRCTSARSTSPTAPPCCAYADDGRGAVRRRQHRDQQRRHRASPATSRR